MTDLQILLLAAVQGLTEFLPVSSSGHLILSPYLFGFADQGLAFDVAVHLGSLIAVLGYFRHTILRVAIAWFAALLPGGGQTADSRLGWAIIVATLPVVFAGMLLKGLVEGELRAPWVIATTTILFGLLLGWIDLRGRRARTIEQVTLGDALWIGASQVLALIPGTSRSGITMTAALALGLTRTDAARFSFLLSIPAILMAGGYEAWKLLNDTGAVHWDAMLLGTVVAAISDI